MTGKERIQAAFAFKTVDRVPAAVLDGGVWITERAGLSFDDLLALDDGGAELVYEAYEAMKSDIIWAGGGCYSMPLRALGAVSNFGEIGHSAEVKPLTDDPEYFKDFDCDTIREKLLADKGIQGILKQTRLLKELAGQDKYVAAISAAPFSIVGQLLGVQNLMVNLFDDELELAPLFEVGVRLCAEINNMLAEAGADIICLGDPVASGALISQDMYEEFALPLTKRAIGLIKGAEHIILHICGDTTPRLESLKGLGISAFSLDTVKLETALEIAYGHYAVMGNLSPFDVMSSMTAPEVQTLARERSETAGLKGGFVVMPGCDLANATPLENILAMTAGAELAAKA